MIRVVDFVSSSLISWNALSYCGPHSQNFLVLRSSLRGWDISAMLGVNFPSWFTIPKNRLKSVTDVGVSILLMDSVLSGSARMPWLSIMWPKRHIFQTGWQMSLTAWIFLTKEFARSRYLCLAWRIQQHQTIERRHCQLWESAASPSWHFRWAL